ncbi:recombinase family protein [Frankia sp. CcWB3]
MQAAISTDSEGGTVGELGAGFVRVSTGSQDETSQVKILAEEAAQRGITIVKWFTLHGYSASHGAQEPALREAIADIQRGDYTTLLVTESSRLDRRDDLDAQAEILLDIRSAGGDIISIAEPQFGKTDFAGRIVTLVAQHANSEKSRTVKQTTYRGISMIIANGAHHGPLPSFWAVKGERYAKQAYCADPESVRDIYERVANREFLQSIARIYDVYPASVKNLVRFAANHTGVEECRYTYEGTTETWVHEVGPVVDSPLWWRANKVIAANLTDARGNKGGRPVAQAANWISGVLQCPSCGAKLHLNAGRAPSGNPRTPKLRCGGNPKARKACGVFTGCDARPIIGIIDSMFSSDTTPILAFQRVAGNAHEPDEMRAEFSRLQSRLSVTEDDDELDALVATRKALRVAIEQFALVSDVYDYTEIGRTVSDMWTSGDTDEKRGMLRAIMTSWGLTLSEHDGQWGIKIGTGFTDTTDADGIVDLGNGFCFRRESSARNGGSAARPR